MKGQLVRIVPAPREKNGLMPVQGTKVYVGDQELTGVTKIVLTAEVGGIWTADITCHHHMQPMEALAVIHYPKRWWERAIDWLAGKTDEP